MLNAKVCPNHDQRRHTPWPYRKNEPIALVLSTSERR